ncbi:MAG: hypothetical protein GWO78_03710 [Dehalococcoidales bacterium]|jgi:hypothetical protein|nr:hypothetical protein [Candidatus Neomarinimicrobiota bacterium]MBT5440424.1 hypothetical protein [Candidatus Neomarinimicrobiota bacterium]MBT7424287.1 hypothetical protein [Candidatus Neomarinimicrobiota bacterium]MDG2366543.1 hypothetical protein [Candidatus Neomarinimicrobiota bacterium]NCG35087.1 hypothetical protein [Dehalococcoidales bacterium]
MNRLLLYILFISSISSQTQVVIEEVMFMEAPYVGKIKTTTQKFASNGFFRQESSLDVDRFIIRMAMGGNKKYGTILNGDSEARIIYDAEEGQYAFESFDLIRNNDGKPTLKGMEENMNFGGGSNRQSDNEEAKDENAEVESEDDEENIIKRTITDEIKVIAGLRAKKVVTSIENSERSVLFEEWFTTDTLLLKYALDKEKELIEAYGGERQNMPRSFAESMLAQSGKEYDSVEGRLLKYSMEMKNEDDKGFKMKWELKDIKEIPFNSDDFVVNKKYKKVEKLD